MTSRRTHKHTSLYLRERKGKNNSSTIGKAILMSLFPSPSIRMELGQHSATGRAGAKKESSLRTVRRRWEEEERERWEKNRGVK